MTFMTKPSVIAIALAGLFAGTSAWAAVQSTNPSLSIHGEKPSIPRIAAMGELKEGKTLTIPADKPEFYQYLDSDGDLDTSRATIEWFIVEPGDTGLPGVGTGMAGNGDGSFTIPLDGSALNKQIGFIITPTSGTGIPDTNAPIYVPDVTKVGGQNPDGTEGGEHGTDNPEVIDNGGDGLVDPGSDNYVVRILNDAGEDILAAGITPMVNSTYTAQIVGATNDVDYTEHFKKSIKWKLQDSETGTLTGVLPVEGSENVRFKTQETNATAQAQQQTHQSEQGMEIVVEFDNDITSPANQ